MIILCVSGKAQHGKDTSATIIYDKIVAAGKKALIIHNADLLKFMCKQFFGWNGEKDEYGRHLLQYVGTDIIRKKEPDFWVQFIKKISELFNSEWDYMIIPDCRFPNEIECLKDSDNIVKHIRVVRDGFKSPLTEEQQKHPSETALDNVVPDYCVYNNGTLDELKAQLYNILDEIRK